MVVAVLYQCHVKNECPVMTTARTINCILPPNRHRSPLVIANESKHHMTKDIITRVHVIAVAKF
jgi:hypothetical protein